jgi:hypothetical protein
VGLRPRTTPTLVSSCVLGAGAARARPGEPGPSSERYAVGGLRAGNHDIVPKRPPPNDAQRQAAQGSASPYKVSHRS